MITLFLIKIFSGAAYAKFYTLPRHYKGSDTWRFYKVSLAETKWLLQDPIAFFKDLFIHNYSKSGNLLSGKNSYWNDLKSNAIIKLMAVINVFTNNSYYADIIFFNFLFLFGLVALFRLLYSIFPDKKLCIIAGIFLLPSTLFWCSGIHKDGLILSSAGIIIYTFYQGFKSRFSVKKTGLILLCMLVVFSLRNYILFALLPAVLAWWLCEKYAGRNIRIFSIVYLSAITFCVIIPILIPSMNIFSFITDKRNEFLLLEGGSKVNMPPLEPGFINFISFIPYALDMAFLRPYFYEVRKISYMPAIIENLLFLFLLFVSMLSLNKKTKLKPVILVLFFFSLSIILVSGYTIPFTGAMVRYRSLALPLLITPLLCLTDFFSDNKIRNYLDKSVNLPFQKKI